MLGANVHLGVNMYILGAKMYH